MIPLSKDDLIRRVAAHTGRRLSARDSKELLTAVMDQLKEQETEKLTKMLTRLESELLTAMLTELGGDDGIINISHMCEQLNVSRGAFNRALRLLQAGGVIECRSRGRKGTWIRVVDAYLARVLRYPAV